MDSIPMQYQRWRHHMCPCLKNLRFQPQLNSLKHERDQLLSTSISDKRSQWRTKDKFSSPDHYVKMKPHASFISSSLNWLLNSLSKNYICIKIWSAPEKLSQFLASCSRLTIQTLWNAETMSFPTYSHPTLFFKFRSSLVIRSCYTLREIALGLGITSRIEDLLFHQRVPNQWAYDNLNHLTP